MGRKFPTNKQTKGNSLEPEDGGGAACNPNPQCTYGSVIAAMKIKKDSLITIMLSDHFEIQLFFLYWGSKYQTSLLNVDICHNIIIKSQEFGYRLWFF